MKNTISYLIVLLLGIGSGYLFIIFSGITYPSTINVWIINTLKEYQLSYLWSYLTKTTEIIVLIFTGIPIFGELGILLNRFIKLEPYSMCTVSAIGTLGALGAVNALDITFLLLTLLFNMIIALELKKKMPTASST